MAGFGQDVGAESKRPVLGANSLIIVLELIQKEKGQYSALRPGDMDALRNRLIAEGREVEVINAVIWRFRNLAGLC